jgi:hypothetical protein
MGDEPRRSQTKADELEECLISFAVRIIRLSANLPKTPAGIIEENRELLPAFHIITQNSSHQ